MNLPVHNRRINLAVTGWMRERSGSLARFHGSRERSVRCCRGGEGLKACSAGVVEIGLPPQVAAVSGYGQDGAQQVIDRYSSGTLSSEAIFSAEHGLAGSKLERMTVALPLTRYASHLPSPNGPHLWRATIVTSPRWTDGSLCVVDRWSGGNVGAR